MELETVLVKKSHAEVQGTLAKLKELATPRDVPEKARELIANIDKIELAYGPVALAIVDFAVKGNKDAAAEARRGSRSWRPDAAH